MVLWDWQEHVLYAHASTRCSQKRPSFTQAKLHVRTCHLHSLVPNAPRPGSGRQPRDWGPLHYLAHPAPFHGSLKNVTPTYQTFGSRNMKIIFRKHLQVHDPHFKIALTPCASLEKKKETNRLGNIGMVCGCFQVKLNSFSSVALQERAHNPRRWDNRSEAGSKIIFPPPAH